MTPPRWPFLVEIDVGAQLNLFYASQHKTTVPLGMRIVGRNLERDSYFIAPLGLHLLYRRLLRRYARAQAVLQALRTTRDGPPTAHGGGLIITTSTYPSGTAQPSWIPTVASTGTHTILPCPAPVLYHNCNCSCHGTAPSNPPSTPTP